MCEHRNMNEQSVIPRWSYFPAHTLPREHYWTTYILKAGFCGFRNPQIILNSLQRDCLTMQKLSISVPDNCQFCNVLKIKVKQCCIKAPNLWSTCSWFQIFQHFAFKLCIFRLLINFSPRFVIMIFFHKFVDPEKQNP